MRHPCSSPVLGKLVLCLGLLSLSISMNPRSAQAEGFSQRQMEVEGKIQFALPINLDDDPRRDLLVFHIKGQGRRAVRKASVFWHRVGGQFSKVPDITWTLHKDVVAVDIHRSSDRSRPSQLFALRPDGLYGYEFPGPRARPKSKRLAAADLAHWQPAPDDLVFFNFAADFDDGFHSGGEADTIEFLLPTVPNSTLWIPGAGPGAAGQGASSKRIEIPVPPQATYGTRSLWGAPAASVRSRLDIPLPVAADQNGDGGRDLVFLQHERMIVVHLDQLDAANRAKVDVFDVDILDPKDTGAPYTVLHRLVDLQGDGRVDLVAAVYRDAGLFEPEGRIMIFRGRKDGTFAAKADQQMSVDSGQYFLTLIEDLSGDGRKELLLPTAKLGVFGVIKLLSGRKLSFTFVSFDPKKDGSYAQGRDTRTSLRALLSQSNDVSAVFFADIDGDKVQDLLVGSKEDAVCIHPGQVNQGQWTFAARSSQCVPESPFAKFIHADLDGDGKQELVSYGVRGKAGRTLTVTFVR